MFHTDYFLVVNSSTGNYVQELLFSSMRVCSIYFFVYDTYSRFFVNMKYH